MWPCGLQRPETVNSRLRFAPLIPWWHCASTADKTNRVWVPHCHYQMKFGCLCLLAVCRAFLRHDSTVHLDIQATPVPPGMQCKPQAHVLASARADGFQRLLVLSAKLSTIDNYWTTNTAYWVLFPACVICSFVCGWTAKLRVLFTSQVLSFKKKPYYVPYFEISALYSNVYSRLELSN